MYGVSLDRERIADLLEDFHTLTGIRIAFVDCDFRHSIVLPREMCRFCSLLREDAAADGKCRDCDSAAFEKAATTKNLYLYECHAGITEAVAPVIIEGKLSGYLMMGQTLNSEPSAEGWRRTREKCRHYRIDPEQLEKAYYEIAHLDPVRLEAAARIMDRSAQFIHLSRLAQIRELPLLEKVKVYVEQNVQEAITADELSRRLEVSSSHLSHSIKSQFGVNLTQYVRSRRLEKARRLLTGTRLEITQVATECGYDDPNYFARLFKRETGLSPTEYRNRA